MCFICKIQLFTKPCIKHTHVTDGSSGNSLDLYSGSAYFKSGQDTNCSD
jgi:hypothetical protein